jgi:hypothetical protein
MTKTIFKLKTLTDYLNSQCRPSAAHTITKFGKMYTMYTDRDQYVYVDAADVKNILVPALWREVSANCTQFVLPVTELKKF